jgi:dihydrolipoamide dehydrogenase
VTFTDPQVCAVGLTREQATQAGLCVRTVRHATGAVPGAAVSADEFPGTSLLVVGEDGALVGATFVGAGTQELLHSATVAIAGGLTLAALWHAVPSFPTVSEIWLRLLETAERELGVTMGPRS